MKYKKGDRVWLADFDNGLEIISREKATILFVVTEPWGISYVAKVDEPEPEDDGLRELTEDQIEGYIEKC